MAVLPTKICNHSTIHHHSPPSPLKEFLKNAPPPAHYVSCFCISGFIFQYSALSLPGLLREPSPLTMGLPTISLAELEQNASSKSCYVTIGSKVYDVTSFISDHPGGGDLILEFVANSPPFRCLCGLLTALKVCRKRCHRGSQGRSFSHPQ
jgi:cytochrome b involved in lipid metabolism